MRCCTAPRPHCTSPSSIHSSNSQSACPCPLPSRPPPNVLKPPTQRGNRRFNQNVSPSRRGQHDGEELVTAERGPAVVVRVSAPERVRQVADGDSAADEAVEADAGLGRAAVLARRRRARCRVKKQRKRWLSQCPRADGVGFAGRGCLQYLRARSWTRFGLRVKPNDWSALPSSGVWIEPDRSASNRAKTSFHSAT